MGPFGEDGLFSQRERLALPLATPVGGNESLLVFSAKKILVGNIRCETAGATLARLLFVHQLARSDCIFSAIENVAFRSFVLE